MVRFRVRTRVSSNEKDDKDWFCYLMKQLGGPCKNEANIKVATEAFTDVYRHNVGEINDKSTKPARGLWQVEMIIGPFGNENAASVFRREWMEESRGIESRRQRGIKLAESYVYAPIRCYDKRVVPLDLNCWLDRHNMSCLKLPEVALTRFYSRLADGHKKAAREAGHNGRALSKKDANKKANLPCRSPVQKER